MCGKGRNVCGKGRNVCEKRFQLDRREVGV